MAYCTQTDMENAVGGSKRLVQLTDWDNTSQLDANRMNAAIAEADALIDSYLVKQFAVPIGDAVTTPSFPIVVRKLSARLAVYSLRLARNMVNDPLAGLTYEKDLKWLAQVASGEVSIGINPQPAPSSMRIDRSTERPTSKDVSRAKLRGFS